MKVGAALDMLEELLAEERDALRRLDSGRVEAAASEKVRLFDILAALPQVEVAEHAPRLQRLRSALRHNGVLLAHARDCVRDALAAVGHIANATTSRYGSARAGARISVKG